MKNLHLLPTDKPSRLHFDSKLFLSPNYQDSKTINSIVEGRNIYITSDEEIKERDWILTIKTNNLFKADSIEYLESHNLIEDFDKSFYINSKYAKKIILTTDQDLIKDGVQAIDDEFLEWFSKWYEVVYYDDKWYSYAGSKTFQDGEQVVDWKYCKDCL